MGSRLRERVVAAVARQCRDTITGVLIKTFIPLLLSGQPVARSRDAYIRSVLPLRQNRPSAIAARRRCRLHQAVKRAIMLFKKASRGTPGQRLGYIYG